MLGFVGWSLVTCIFIAFGLGSWSSDETVGFFSGVKPPEIPPENVKSYNHAVAMIWFGFCFVFELIGLPLLFSEQDSPYFIITLLGAMFSCIMVAVIYLIVENHYKKK